MQDDYEAGNAAITKYYTNERNKVEEDYAQKAEDRLESLSSAWLALVASFDKYDDALRNARTGEMEDQYDTAIDTGKFEEATKIRTALREAELKAEKRKKLTRRCALL